MKQYYQSARELSRPVKIGIIIIALLMGWLIFGHSGNDESRQSGRRGKNSGPAPVGAATAKTGDINIYLDGLGTITPKNIVTIHSRVDGELLRILFTEGQAVKAGDIIAEIDPRPYQAQLDQAIGQMNRDTALLKDAKINLARYKTLFKQDSIAKQQLDSQAALVKQYEGTVQADQGQVNNAKLQLGYTKITTPIDGRIGLRQVDTGNIIHPGDANGIAVVTQLQPITAIFSLPEDNIPAVMKHVQAGDVLIVEAWSRDNKINLARGYLLAVDNQVDTATGTVKFKAEFSNEDNALFANQFVNIHMLLETKKDMVLIPAAAVHQSTKGAFVYVVKEDKTAALQNVTLGQTENENIAVEDGLKAGDIVVVDGSDSLTEGAKIEIASLDGIAIDDNKTGEGEKKNPDDNKSAKHRHKKEEP